MKTCTLLAAAALTALPGLQTLAQEKPATAPAAPSTPAQPAKPEASESKPAIGHEAVFESAELTEVTTGFKFAEGPLWWGDKLVVCDLGGSVVYTFTPGKDEKPVVFRDASESAAGSTLDREGRLLLAHFAGKITRTEKDGTVKVIADKCDDQPLGKCNDVVVRTDGTIYFTDFAGGKTGRSVLRIAPDGKVIACKGDFKAANGLTFSPDEKILYVADYGAKLVKAFDVAASGELSNEREFVNFKGEAGGGTPDGMKVDTAGNLFTTGPGGVWVIKPDGTKLAKLPVRGMSNVAFGGADGKTLYITAGAKAYSVKVKVAGVMAGGTPK